MASMGRRIVVEGASGSGKTVVAARLARHLGVPHVELDALHHGPNWSEPPLEEFRRRVEEATAASGWVVDGNYDSKLGDRVIGRSDLVVWLDPPLRTILVRLWRRTSARIRDRTDLWSGNRESWRNALRGRDSLFLWAIRTHRRLRRELPASARRAEVELIRLRKPDEVERWLDAQTSTTTGRIIGLRRVRS
jgi:adenylate kinase family enzyme